MVDHLLRIALLHNHTIIHEDQLIGHVSGESHLVCDDDHGRLLVCKGADDLQHFSRQLRIQR